MAINENVPGMPSDRRMQQGEALCQSFCQCTLDKLQAQSLLTQLQANEIDVQNDERVQTIAGECSAEVE